MVKLNLDTFGYRLTIKLDYFMYVYFETILTKTIVFSVLLNRFDKSNRT